MPNKNPLAALEDETKDHEKKLEKMKGEMGEVFGRKVEEKQARLAESEKEMKARLEESKELLEEQKEELERQREEFKREKKVRSAVFL